MHEVSTLRLYLLRGTFLLIALAMGLQIWPAVFRSPDGVEHMRGVVRSMLGAITLLSLLGVRYPLKMLPLLFVEVAWKAIWVASVGVPLWARNGFDAATRETWVACLMGLVLFPLAIPWGYVLRTYVRAPGDRWGMDANRSSPVADAPIATK